VILDTGSSDLYFDASSAAACETDGAFSCKGGTLTPGKSSTYKIVEPAPAFDTKFGDGSTASGPFAEDTVCISDICISNVQFGVAQQVKSATGYAIGLMGLGYSLNEATRHLYPNIPEVLADAGVINSRLYSVYLNDEGATSGSILFGGIDTSKYTGTLQTVDILPDAQVGGIDQFITTVTALKADVGGKSRTVFSGGSPGAAAYFSNNPSLPVLLDTGSSAWSVPQNVYAAIVENFPYVDQQGICDCSHADGDDTITVTFENKIDITVPAKDFIVPAYNRTTNVGYEYPNGDHQCVFMIVPSQGTGQGFDTLGDAVLRSMYVVFDLDNGQMALAQAQVNSTASPDIYTVQAGPSGIAKAVSNVATAPPQSSYPIAKEINGTASHKVSTAKTTLGTATGEAAVPAGARVSASSSGAAMSVLVPPMDWSAIYVITIASVMAMVGAGVML
jgi:hypothetical protein